MTDPLPPTTNPVPGTPASETADGDPGPASWERHVVTAVLALGFLTIAGGGAGIGFLARDPAWAQAADVARRTRATLSNSPEELSFEARYAQDLVKLAAYSPEPLRGYLNWRADAHCTNVRDATPAGTFGSCRRLHLERLRLSQDGPGLRAAAQSEMEGAPRHWIAPLQRYAGTGAVMAEEWEAAREHFSTAFTVGGLPRDALHTGWACLKTGQPALALEWLDRAFAINGGYPSPFLLRQTKNPFRFRGQERDRFAAELEAEAAFYRACRAAAVAALDGRPAPIPEPVSGLM